MNILVAAMTGFGNEEATKEPSVNPLQDGYIAEGNASGPTGDHLWCDDTVVTTYGGGNRYAHEETAYMTRVKSKNR